MGREMYVIRDAEGRRLNDQLQAKRYGNHHQLSGIPAEAAGDAAAREFVSTGTVVGRAKQDLALAKPPPPPPGSSPGLTAGAAAPEGRWELGTSCVIPAEAGDGEGLPAAIGPAAPGARRARGGACVQRGPHPGQVWLILRVADMCAPRVQPPVRPRAR